MMIIFAWIGIVLCGALVLIFLWFAFLWAMSRGVEFLWDCRKKYRRGKLHKKFVNRAGLDCATWLVRYNETHGMNRWEFTASDWEKFFTEQLKRVEMNEEIRPITGISVICHNSDEVRKVLAIADIYGLHWWDTRNGGALCGYQEVIESAFYKGEALISFHGDIVDWGNESEDDRIIAANDFISMYLNRNVELQPAELQTLNVGLVEFMPKFGFLLQSAVRSLLTQLNKEEYE